MIAERQRALCHLQAYEIQSARLLGGWLPGIERWEVKHEVGLHLWDDARHSQALRLRLWELRVPDPDRDLATDVPAVVRAIAAAQSDTEFLAGAYLVLKQSLLDAYHAYLASTSTIYDAPTVAALRSLAAEKEAQVAWARRALDELLDSGQKRRDAERWMAYVRALITAHGGVDGGGERTEPPAPLPGYGLRLPFADARRDGRFRLGAPALELPDEDDALGSTLFQFANYGAEMQAAETLGSLLWETDGMPWDFAFDVARHCTDEVRHSKLGEVRLAQLGHHLSDFPHTTGNYAWRQLVDPLRRYCALTYVIEADSFAYKHATYQRYLERGDQESATAVLYDIMDETLHVRWGKKWVPELMRRYGYEGTLPQLVDECRALVRARSLSPKQREAAAVAASATDVGGPAPA